MKRNKLILFLLPLVVVAAVVVLAFGRRSQVLQYQKDSGFIFGTTYNVTYQSNENLKAEIEQALKEVDFALSPFNKQSIITAINQNRDTTINSLFLDVFKTAGKVFADTEGAFDITVAPLVNAWGFGFKNGTMPDDRQIDSIKAFVGFNMVKVDEKLMKITKADPRLMLDCGAVAKGYGVDRVAAMLRSKGISNFLVEIGGEVVAEGVNPEKQKWRIGILQPNDDSLSVNEELQAIVSLNNVAMATSGNYRNFYYKDGRKYAHTIDPATGRPVQHNILSATVLAPTCAMADAYATAFMVMGLDKAKEVLSRHDEMKAYLICTNNKGGYYVWHSPEMSDDIAE